MIRLALTLALTSGFALHSYLAACALASRCTLLLLFKRFCAPYRLSIELGSAQGTMLDLFHMNRYLALVSLGLVLPKLALSAELAVLLDLFY